MDITKTIFSLREAIVLYGDYATYQSQLSKKLLKTRKKLNIATKNRGKFHPKAQVTPEEASEDHEFVRLQLLTAERAWAHAMAIKSAHSAGTKGISSHTRSHIVSRLDKGAKAAAALAEALSQAAAASQTDVLESRAYAALLSGSSLFEKKSWDASIKSYATARIIYSALSASTGADMYKNLLSETIDPSIRYAAYQLKIPRTQPVPTIAQRAFPHSDTALVQSINELSPAALKHGDLDAKQGFSGPDGAPTTLTWRSREVKIEDAAIAVAWAAVDTAKERLAERLAAAAAASWPPKDRASLYDDVVIATQDAVDATKHAIDELKGEGVSQSDPRMQGLQVTRTAVNYEMINWRIGRNRVLMGDKDGATADAARPSRRKAAAKADRNPPDEQDVPPGRQVARLKEKVALYDSTLQSLESVRELPGVASDRDLSGQIRATAQYFSALRALAIARSCSLADEVINALALTNHAQEQCKESLPVLGGEGASPESSLPSIAVTRGDVKALDSLLAGELQRSRALAEIWHLRKEAAEAASRDEKSRRQAAAPLVERLSEYPPGGAVDLDHLVTYPPKAEPIPVKPIFLDIAWNYIKYPQVPDASGPSGGKNTAPETAQETRPQKKGWFGFGR